MTDWGIGVTAADIKLQFQSCVKSSEFVNNKIAHDTQFWTLHCPLRNAFIRNMSDYSRILNWRHSSRCCRCTELSAFTLIQEEFSSQIVWVIGVVTDINLQFLLWVSKHKSRSNFSCSFKLIQSLPEILCNDTSFSCNRKRI